MKKFWLIAILGVVAAMPDLTPAQTSGQAEVLLEAAKKKEVVSGDLEAAIRQYRDIVAKFTTNRAVSAEALLRMGQCYEKLGEAQAKEAGATYERVVREFGDQTEIAAQARARLAALGRPGGDSGLVARRILEDASGVSGVLSADGKYLRRVDGSTGDVIQFDLVSGQTSRVTNTGGPEAKRPPLGNKAFSRDGKQVAYDTAKDGAYEVRIRNLDGSGLRTVYSEKGFYAMPLEWSPEGGSVLALRRDLSTEPIQLALISTSDGLVRVLKTMPPSSFVYQTASVSPDGQSVAFSYVREGSPPHADLFVMKADGRDEVVVAGHPAEDRLLQWTQDGRGLLFLSDRSGTWDIWTVDIAGGTQQGEPKLLKRDFGADAEVLGIAPNGSLYYRTDTPLGRLFCGAIDLETGKVIEQPEPVPMRYTSPVVMPTWSPDGKNLAYISHQNRFGTGVLTIRSATTGEERFPSPRLRSVFPISWAPDSRSIIGRGSTTTRPIIVRIDAETGEFTKLTDGNALPHVCPDGKTLVLMGMTGTGGITERNLDTGEESEVVKAGKTFYDLSPDCREAVFLENGAVKIIPLNGGEPRELFRGSAASYGLDWSLDGRYIFAVSRRTASSEIWRIPAQGGTPLKLDFSVPKAESFALHPDNRRFAISTNEGTRSELWVLENFLPAANNRK